MVKILIALALVLSLAACAGPTEKRVTAKLYRIDEQYPPNTSKKHQDCYRPYWAGIYECALQAVGDRERYFACVDGAADEFVECIEKPLPRKPQLHLKFKFGREA